MIWFLHNLDLLARERAAIDEFQSKVPWLKGATWRLDGSNLTLDADLEAHGYVYAVRMSYPATFPANPPTVSPREEGLEIWSTHQYGPSGELCLEWGPDTWVPEVTGALVLESAHRLLDAENPKGVVHGERALIALSRHALTAGQEMRRVVYRFLTTAALRARLDSLSTGANGEIEALGLTEQHETITALVAVLRLEELEPWVDPDLPPRLKAYSISWRGLFVKTDLPAEHLWVDTVEEFRTAVKHHAVFSARLEAVLVKPDEFALLLAQDNAGGLHLFRLLASKNQLIRFRALALPPERQWERRGPEMDGLATKSASRNNFVIVGHYYGILLRG